MSSMPWFRMYAEVYRDPKIQRLSDGLKATWLDILCLACEYGGEIPVADLQHKLPHRCDVTMNRVSALINHGLLTYGGGLVIPHNWYGRQYRSDLSTERVRRFRSRKMKRFRNVPSETLETAPDKKVSKKEREKAKKWVAELEARLAAQTQPTNVTSLDALRNLKPLGEWKD